MDLTDGQKRVLESLIWPWRSSREVLNGVLWILHTRVQRADLLERYPPYQTRHRRFQRSHAHRHAGADLRHPGW